MQCILIEGYLRLVIAQLKVTKSSFFIHFMHLLASKPIIYYFHPFVKFAAAEQLHKGSVFPTHAILCLNWNEMHTGTLVNETILNSTIKILIELATLQEISKLLSTQSLKKSMISFSNVWIDDEKEPAMTTFLKLGTTRTRIESFHDDFDFFFFWFNKYRFVLQDKKH